MSETVSQARADVLPQDLTLVGVPEERINAAEAFLAERVNHPTRDAIAAHQDRALQAPGPDVRGRLRSLAELSYATYNTREMQGGVERQKLKPDQIDWAALGFSHMMDQQSASAQNMLRWGDELGMLHGLEPVHDKYDIRSALGAFGLSALHRVQLMNGHSLSVPGKDGRLPLSQPNDLAHPAYAARDGLFVGVGASRPVAEAEAKKVADYAPDAKREFDLMVAATEWVLQADGRRVTKKVRPFVNTTYAQKDPTDLAQVVTHEVDGGNALHVNLYVPTPATAKRGRAQTQHTYALLRDTLTAMHLAEPGDRMLTTTNAHFNPFQKAAAMAELALRVGIEVDMGTFSPYEAGLDRKGHELVPELHSEVKHLETLQAAIDIARGNQLSFVRR
ncbi:MAG TPA: hypothetical protein VD735_05370 [Candidatus Saccharimonadales bacterium]|nr:hypothetical protein [Candidatus Saccharimonadales bacterium]